MHLKGTQRRRCTVRCVVTLAVLLAWHGAGPVPPTSVAAQDAAPVPDVRTFRGDAARTGVQPGPSPVVPLATLWRFPTEDKVSSSAAVVDGLLYIGSSDHHLYALDAQQGALVWRFDAGGNVVSSPAVEEGLVIIGSFDGNVYAVDANEGTERWRFGTNGSISASAVLVTGTVIIGSDDGFLYALDVATGTERWRVDTGGSIVAS